MVQTTKAIDNRAQLGQLMVRAAKHRVDEAMQFKPERDLHSIGVERRWIIHQFTSYQGTRHSPKHVASASSLRAMLTVRHGIDGRNLLEEAARDDLLMLVGIESSGSVGSGFSSWPCTKEPALHRLRSRCALV